MNKKTVWTGSYRGINWEIVNWMIGEKDAWNSYIYIFNESDIYPKLAAKLWSKNKRIYKTKRRTHSSYEPLPILNNLHWHCGQTFYSQIVENDSKYIKIGDDYQHLHDEGQIYDIEYVFDNIKIIIDGLEVELKQIYKNDK
jgi:hypothetical protein